MAKLTDNNTQEAWEDFIGYMIDVGFLPEYDERDHRSVAHHRIAKAAFKQGFVAGAQSIKSDFMTRPTIHDTPVKIKRTREPRTMRTPDERAADNWELEMVLLDNKEPMQLGEIIAEMIRRGFTNFTTNNGSSFVRTAIKDGAKIKQHGFGSYVYDWGRNSGDED